MLIVQALNQMNNEWQRLFNFEIYIGDDATWQNNPKCPGSPFLETGTEYIYDTVKAQSYWPGGVEAWCNMEGRYTTVVADYTSKSGNTQLTPSLCQFGVFGTRYIRVTPFIDSVSVQAG